ncbi:unnamed protein product, partial [Ectocarpus sp. 12 AP-2014]
MEAPKEQLTPLYQCLDLEVDIDKSFLRGRTSIWLLHIPSHGRYDSYPTEIKLHCRQNEIKA